MKFTLGYPETTVKINNFYREGTEIMIIFEILKSQKLIITKDRLGAEEKKEQ